MIHEYEVLRTLGDGAFGVVVEAVKPEAPERRYAIKILRDELSREPVISQRFLQEGLILARLDHPAIPKVYKVSPWGNTYYLVMDLVEGEALDTLLEQGPFDLDLAIDVTEKLLDALAYAHGRDVLHRDLKPENVVIDGDAVRILDFGIAKILGGIALTQPHSFLGTILYAPPEQMEGKDVDVRADLYTLGILFHEMLTGEPPNRPKEGADIQVAMEQLKWATAGPRDSLKRLRPDIPDPLDAFFRKCCAAAPDDRFPDAASALAALRACRDVASVADAAWAAPDEVEEDRDDPRQMESAGVPDRCGENLDGADLRGENLDGADLRGEDLDGADLSNASLVGADLSGASLIGADLSGANLDGADLRGADLSGASLVSANLRHARLSADTSLRRAGLVGARFDREGFERADTWGASSTSASDLRHTLFTADIVTGLAWSPRGALLASGHRSGAVRLWEAPKRANPRGLAALGSHDKAVLDVAFSPDGRTLATVAADGAAILWDVGRGSSEPLHIASASIRSLAFSPEGALIALGTEDGEVRLRDLERRVTVRSLRGHESAVESLAFDAHGRRLVSASADQTVRLWDVTSGAPVQVFRGHERAVASVAFSPDGLTVASASRNRTVRLWDLPSGEMLRVLSGHRAAVDSIAFTPDGGGLTSAAPGETIRWDLEKGTGSVRRSDQRRRRRGCLAYSADGRTLAVADGARVVLEDTAEAVTRADLESRGTPVVAVATCQSGQALLTGASTGHAWLWDTTTWRRGVRLGEPLDELSAVALSPDGRRAMTAYRDATVRLWDARSGEPGPVLDGHRFPVTSLAVSPDGRRLASGSNDRTVQVWAADGSERLLRLEGHEQPVRDVCFAPDGQTLASGGGDDRLFLWDARDGRSLGKWKMRGRGVNSVAFSADGLAVVAGLADGTVAVRALGSGRLLRRIGDEDMTAAAIALNPDGRRLATTDREGARLVELASGSDLWTVEVPEGRVRALCFSATGDTLFGAVDDGTVRLWDARNGRPLAELHHLTDGWVAITPSGRYAQGGDLAESFWLRGGLHRFELGALDAVVEGFEEVPDGEPLLLAGSN